MSWHVALQKIVQLGLKQSLKNSIDMRMQVR